MDSKSTALKKKTEKAKKVYHLKKSFEKSKKRLNLETGMKGFFCTCNFHEKDCIKEAYNLLNEYADKVFLEVCIFPCLYACKVKLIGCFKLFKVR